MEYVWWIITGGVAAAGVKIIDNVVMWCLNRKAKHKDDERVSIDEIVQTILTLKTAQKVILHDRLKYLCRFFIGDGEVSYDDRRDLVEMHKIYHDGLSGNGNLDALMGEVMQLPIKK